MGPAFITGLPRSRTYWFAEYFSACGVTAYHELLNGCKSRERFYEVMEEGGINSDCGLSITDFQERFPKAPCLIIHRDISDVMGSLVKFHEKMGWPAPSFDLLEGLQQKLYDLVGMHIMYDEIDDRLGMIHQYLAPETDWDPVLAGQMISKTLQVDPATYKVDFDSYGLWAA